MARGRFRGKRGKKQRSEDRQTPPWIKRKRWDAIRDEAHRAFLFILVMGPEVDFISENTGKSVLSWHAHTRVARMTDGGIHRLETVEEALRVAMNHRLDLEFPSDAIVAQDSHLAAINRPDIQGSGEPDA